MTGHPAIPGRRARGAAGRALLPPVPALIVLLVLGAGGCATYSAKMVDLRPQLAAGDFDGALQTIEKHGAGSKDVLLSWLEQGLVLHYADRYPESNEAFAAAERTADELLGASLGEGVLSLLSNDNAISYRGEPFELAMVPYFRALNYAYLGQREEAVVEARRASVLLAQHIDATLEGVREEDRAALDQVRNDAFLLYVSGMLYDWDGEINDAFIAYRNAAVAYQQNAELLRVEAPPALAGDLARTADRLGFGEELAQTARACPAVFAGVADTTLTLRELRQASRWPAGRGEVVVLLETGFVPRKTQVRFDFPIFKDDGYQDRERASWLIYDNYGRRRVVTKGREIEHWVSVAAPELQDDQPEIYRSARVSAAAGGAHAASARAANLARLSRVTFDAQKPTIFFKTILRGLTKYLATRGARKAGGEAAGILANIFGAATESADTRSWMTLPAQIHLARLTLPPGVHDLRVELLDAQGRVAATHTVGGVEVAAGEWTFVSRRIF